MHNFLPFFSLWEGQNAVERAVSSQPGLDILSSTPENLANSDQKRYLVI